MSKKLKYALYINDVLVEKFYTLAEVDEFIDKRVGYMGKIEVKKI